MPSGPTIHFHLHAVSCNPTRSDGTIARFLSPRSLNFRLIPNRKQISIPSNLCHAAAAALNAHLPPCHFCKQVATPPSLHPTLEFPQSIFTFPAIPHPPTESPGTAPRHLEPPTLKPRLQRSHSIANPHLPERKMKARTEGEVISTPSHRISTMSPFQASIPFIPQFQSRGLTKPPPLPEPQPPSQDLQRILPSNPSLHVLSFPDSPTPPRSSRIVFASGRSLAAQYCSVLFVLIAISASPGVLEWGHYERVSETAPCLACMCCRVRKCAVL